MGDRFVVETRIVKVAHPEGVIENREEIEYLDDPKASVLDWQLARDVQMARAIFQRLLNIVRPKPEDLWDDGGMLLKVEYFRLEWVAVLDEVAKYGHLRYRPRLVIKLVLMEPVNKSSAISLNLIVCAPEPISEDFFRLTYRQLTEIMLAQLRIHLVTASQILAEKTSREVIAQQNMWANLARAISGN